METRPSPLSPEVWLDDLFSSKAARQGGVIRRKARDVERYAGRTLFLAEVARRGFQVAENGGQYVIFCNQAPVRWLTVPPAAPRSFKEREPKSLKDFGAPARPPAPCPDRLSRP